MVDIRPETARQEMLRGLLEAHGKRYYEAQRCIRVPGSDTERRLREWFEGWHIAIQDEYRRAINADDGIIGKQWQYDHTVQKHQLITVAVNPPPPIEEDQHG